MTSDRTAEQMAIGRDRFFYSGLLGNSGKPRTLGCVTIHVAPQGPIDAGLGKSGPFGPRAIIALPPYGTHRLMAPRGRILTLGFEPESLDDSTQADLIARANDPVRGVELANRIRAAAPRLTEITGARGFSNADFDALFLRAPLPPRQMDARIKTVVGRICSEIEDSALGADTLAATVGLSTSRFLHLFKDHTGIAFRSFRMWKRARRFLDHANSSDSLTEVALDLGYPDSSHFSHSIRRIYGLKPRSIRTGSRNLKIYAGAGYTLGPQRATF